MTLKDREDRFIEACRKDFNDLTFESERLLRWGFSHGAEELFHDAFEMGARAQRESVLRLLGATPLKMEPTP